MRWLADFVRRFFTAPTDGSSASLFRIAFGVLATWTALGVLWNLDRYYGAQGLVPWRSVRHFPELYFTPFALFPGSDGVPLLLALAFLVASLLLTAGVRPRLCALCIFLVNVALQHRNPYVVNSGDRLFVILAALSTLMPLGARWSLGPTGTQPGWLWGQRLVQLQIAYIYLFSCFSKLRYSHWLDGTALTHVLASPVLSEWPATLEPSVPLRLLAWGTLLFELTFPLLVWHKRLRPYFLIGGVVFHLGIEVLLRIPMFSAIMIVSYACFVSDSASARLVGGVLRPLGGLRRLARTPSVL
ncbi:MAG TPA: HTTM domain-containing protein [Polyangiaceae bacterium]|nr:HTTM domain-containing protein [Polyangiaceae bacterium]